MPASYQPNIGDPLVGLPDNLANNYRLELDWQRYSAFCEGRPFLFRILRQNQSVNREMIWKYLFPRRPFTTCRPLSAETVEQSYHIILSFLVSWFTVNPLTQVNFHLWSTAQMVALMRNKGADFEAKSLYLNCAIRDIRDLFKTTPPELLELLSSRLMETYNVHLASQTRPTKALPQRKKLVSSQHV